jgi:uncharacterized membrane protein
MDAPNEQTTDDAGAEGRPAMAGSTAPEYDAEEIERLLEEGRNLAERARRESEGMSTPYWAR